jgi:hypothetical protein
MKRLALVGAALTALAAAGIAVARGNDVRSVASVSGTFTATSVSGTSHTTTCTTADGKSLTATRATYTGTASGPADLTGPVRIDASSLIDTTDNVGTVDGRMTISPSGGGRADLRFTGVYDGGTVVGLGTGHSAGPGVRLVANLSAGFSPTGGFNGGKLGGAAGGSAVELTPGRCAPNKATHERTSADGTVSAVSSTSITVAGLTCTVPPSLATQVATFKMGDRAHIECMLVSGTNTLTRISPKKGSG